MVQSSPLSIEVTKTDNSNIHLLYKISDSSSGLLNIALIQPEATTQVRKGENNGRKLHHVNIVSRFKTIEVNAKTGSVDLEIPPELRELPFNVILSRKIIFRQRVLHKPL